MTTLLRRLVVSLLVFGAAPTPVLAQDLSVGIEESVASTQSEVSIEPAARDTEIGERIRDIMSATGWYRGLRISVDEGIVFLDGQAASQERKAWAGELATKTEGTVAVVNRITVERIVSWSLEPVVREVRTLSEDAIRAFPYVVLAAIVLPLAWIVAKVAGRTARWIVKSRARSPFIERIVGRVISIAIFLVGLYLVLQVAGLTQLAVSVIGGAGVIGIVVGFAFRDIAENFLASLLLSLRQPFRRGDFIDVAGQMGTVQSMNTRSTVLVSLEGNHIQIPNATLFKNTITNYSTAPKRRETLDVGVGYDVAINDAQAVIHQVLLDHEAVLKTPEPMVLVDSLGGSTVNLRAYFWFDGHRFSMLKVRSALLRLVKRALIEQGISMPDEAREIIFPEGLPIRQMADGGKTIEETAPAPLQRKQEPDTSASVSEGDLGSEVEDIQEHAAPDDNGTDLLNGSKAAVA